MSLTHVVVDVTADQVITHDHLRDGEQFTAETAAAYAAERNRHYKPEHRLCVVFELVSKQMTEARRLVAWDAGATAAILAIHSHDDDV